MRGYPHCMPSRSLRASSRSPRSVPLGLAAALLLSGGLFGPDGAVVRSSQPLGAYLEVRLAGETDVRVLLPATPVTGKLSPSHSILSSIYCTEVGKFGASMPYSTRFVTARPRQT